MPTKTPDKPETPVQIDDNLDDQGRDINSGKIDEKHHPQGEIERGFRRDDRR